MNLIGVNAYIQQVIKGAIIAIAICYVVAYVLKFLIITIQKGTEVYEDDEQ